MAMSTRSQLTQILNHLKRGRSLTAIQALNKFGCMRLSARILDLKEMGYSIASDYIKQDGKRFARYRLAE